MGVDNLGTVHAIYQRGVGAEQTLYYKSKSQDVIVDNEGNGSLLFERRILQMENNNIRYFGYAAP